MNIISVNMLKTCSAPFVLLLLTLFTVSKMAMCCTIDYDATIVKFPDQYLSGKRIVYKIIMGYQMCIMDCLTRNCNIVNFNKESFLCQLSAKYHKSLQDGSALSDDSKYISVNVSRSPTDEERKALQSAKLTERDDDYVCITTKTLKIACVREDFTPLDCKGIRDQGRTLDGVYTLYLTQNGTETLRAYCEMEDSNGWTVFQRRKSGLTNFYRGWNEYRDGFGDPADEYWLGNKYLHQLTKSRSCQLKIDLVTLDNKTGYALYDDFSVGSEDDGFPLYRGQFMGKIPKGDNLPSRHGPRFLTWDRDNDDNCAQKYGGWWYGNCKKPWSNVNGHYNRSAIHRASWNNFGELKESTMKVKCK